MLYVENFLALLVEQSCFQSFIKHSYCVNFDNVELTQTAYKDILIPR